MDHIWQAMGCYLAKNAQEKKHQNKMNLFASKTDHSMCYSHAFWKCLK